GMKQRVGLAGAFAGAPQVLVLDEPTDGIDPIGRMEIRELLAARVREGVTVFLNSHLLAETERLCDHVAILGGGRLLVSGALADLRSQGAPRARFEPRPDLPELCARHDLHPVEGGWAARDATPETMSRALAGILAEGAVLRELTEPASDLEMVLREAVEAEAA
ncbi:MAG: ABC transporter ATP-binding protein, partial [Myxococcota bacterium]